MNKTVSSPRLIALILMIAMLIVTLSSCTFDMYHPYYDEVLFDSRNKNIAEAFTEAKYDFVVTMDKIIEIVGFVSFYEYTITIDIYDKTADGGGELCAHYVIDEIFLSDKSPYEVMDYHEEPTLLPTAYNDRPVVATMLQATFDEMARAAVLISINKCGLPYEEDAIRQLAEDFRNDTLNTTQEFFEQYAGSIAPDGWGIVGEVLGVFENFPMPDTLTHNIKSFFYAFFDFLDFSENTTVPDELNLIAGFMSTGVVEWLHKAEENALALISDEVVQEQKQALAEKTNAFAETIIRLCNEG